MIYQELKRRFFTRFVLISIMGIFIMTVGLNGLLVGWEKNLSEHLKEEAIYAGEMTEDKLWMALEKVRDEKSEEIRYKSLVSFIYGLTSSYPGLLYTENRIEDFPDAYAKEFYKCWRKKATVLIEKSPIGNQPIALEELNKVKEPFYKYPGSYIWGLGLDNLAVIYIVILFLVTFFAAATYSDSMEDGSMEIIRSTKMGKRMMAVRLLPVLLYGLILILVATLGTVVTLGLFTGFQALKSSFKVIVLFSIGNFTIIDGMIIMFVSEILGVLSLTTMMGWISYKTGKTSLAIAIGSAIHIFYIMTSFFINIPLKSFRVILNALPMASSQVIYEMPGFRFDMLIWRPYAIMLSMSVMFIMFGILLRISINRANTRG